MNNISGKIQVRETKTALKDLIVIAYDYDLTSLDDVFSNLDSGNYRLLASILLGSDGKEDKDIPRVPPGDRIGSTITDSKGSFKFNFEDEVFNRGEKELRPDLILFVLAPDYAISQDSYIGTPENQRILHMAFYPIRNAGREESMIISISESQLAKFNLTPSKTKIQKQDHVFSAIESSYSSNEQLKYERLKGNIRANIEKNKSRKDRAKVFTEKLSALPTNFIANDPLFLNAKTITADVLESTLNIAARNGIQKVAEQTYNNLVHKPQLILELGRDWLDKIITDERKDRIIQTLEDGGFETNVQIDYGNFCAMKYSKTNGTVLRSTTSLLEQRLNRDNVLKKLESLGSSGDTSTTDDEPIDPNRRLGIPWDGTESKEEYIKKLVLSQVQELSSESDLPILNENNPDLSKENINHIKISLDELMPPAGPADITAFYDINTLQIAYPNVWTEAFDGDVEALMQRMRIDYEDAYEIYKEGTGDILNRLESWDEEELYDLNTYTNLMGELSDDIKAFGPVNIPSSVRNVFGGGDITFEEEYKKLSLDQQQELLEISMEYQETLIQQAPDDADAKDDFGVGDFLRTKVFSVSRLEDLGEPDKMSALFNLFRTKKKDTSDDGIDWQAEKESRLSTLSARGWAILGNPKGGATKAQRTMAELAERLKHPHSFKIYPENSYNFGIVTSMRQQWVKGPYQATNLVSSMTLAPGQKMTYSKEEVIKKSIARKEAENHSSTLNDERIYSTKVTSDVVEKLSKNTNFAVSHESEGSGGISGIFNVRAQTGLEFKKDQAAEYQKNVNAVREATRKAAQEYKNERSLEISTEMDSEFKTSITSEISNPNNEITVTYLFYELERQYKVTEHLNKVTPVILVAQHVPAPHEIDEDWILSYEWILRRNILDVSFLDALDFIAEGLIGDEVSLEVLRENHETQKALVEELSTTVSTFTQMQESLRDTLIQTSEREKIAEVAKKRRKKRRRRHFFKKLFNPASLIAEKIASGRSNLSLGNEDPEMLEARREALETRLEYVESNMEKAQSQLTEANSALTKVSEDLETAIKESFTKKNLVTQLKIHIKENILYYMQGIWSYEYEHQRYMRLYNLPVKVPMPGPEPDSAGGSVTTNIDISPVSDNIRDGLYGAMGLGNTGALMGVTLNWLHSDDGDAIYHEVEKRLHEIADVDNMLGFKGNYMMFPLKECTFITDYMMQDYVDEYLGVRTPDPLSQYSTDELLKLAENVMHNEDTTAAQREALVEIITERLNSPRKEDELIVLPTGQLYIEALKGSHALLEDFKLKHRKMDMLKVKEEVRGAQLENLRKALRLVNEDKAMLEDPDIDKKVMVKGSADVTITD